MQSRVVCNLVSTLDSCQDGHRDIGEVSVGNDSQRPSVLLVLATDGGQVRECQAFEIVAVEPKGSVNGGQRWDTEGGHISEGHVGSSLQVGKLDVQL